MTEDQNVFFELYRPSDEAHSEPKHFRYKPRAEIRWVMGFHPSNIIALVRLWAFTLQILLVFACSYIRASPLTATDTK